MLIDTHTHLYLAELKPTRNEWFQRMLDTKVQLALLPNIDVESIDAMYELAQWQPSHFRMMMGLHPCDIKENWEKDLDIIKKELYQNPNIFCGVGEIGLDYHWDTTFIENQKKALILQFEWAIDLDKAVSIHARKSVHDILPLISIFSKKGLKGVMHCFSGSLQDAKKIVDCGFMLGIGGVVTFPNAGLADILPQIPLENIVLETDSPFLAPRPHRGKQNESAYLSFIVQKLAEIYNCSEEKISEITTNNAIRTFDLVL